MTGQSCELCGAATGSVTAGFKAVLPDAVPMDEKIAESDDFILILDTAPVATGHALLVPRKHCSSLATSWCADGDQLYTIENSVVSHLQRTMATSVIVCEHGLAPDAPARAGCVEHAHLHFIPVRRPIVAAFRAAGVQMESTSTVCEALVPAGWTQYLYLLDADGVRYVARGDRFPSQLVRRLVALENGDIFWSWRDYVDFTDVIGTGARLRDGRLSYGEFRGW